MLQTSLATLTAIGSNGIMIIKFGAFVLGVYLFGMVIAMAVQAIKQFLHSA